MKPVGIPLSTAEEKAIIWHANQLTEAALAEGIIVPEQKNRHWEEAASDLLDDPDLLAKMVLAHAKGGNSMHVVLDHLGMMRDDDTLESAASQYVEKMPAHRGVSRRRTALGAAALTLTTSLGPPLAPQHLQAQTTITQNAPFPTRRQPDLPPGEPPTPVSEKRPWADKHRRREGGEPELC